MTEPLEVYIRALIGPDDTHLTDVLSAFVPRRIRRNEVLLEAGEVCQYCYFVVKGCLQVSTLTDAGEESTRDFVFENNWLTDIYGFSRQKPATEYFRAVEPSVVLAIHREHFSRLQEQVPQFERIYRQIIELSFTNAVYRVNTFISFDAPGRVRWLMHSTSPKLSHGSQTGWLRRTSAFRPKP